jgi:hypothetical protein
VVYEECILSGSYVVISPNIVRILLEFPLLHMMIVLNILSFVFLQVGLKNNEFEVQN